MWFANLQFRNYCSTSSNWSKIKKKSIKCSFEKHVVEFAQSTTFFCYKTDICPLYIKWLILKSINQLKINKIYRSSNESLMFSHNEIKAVLWNVDEILCFKIYICMYVFHICYDYSETLRTFMLASFTGLFSKSFPSM